MAEFEPLPFDTSHNLPLDYCLVFLNIYLNNNIYFISRSQIFQILGRVWVEINPKLGWAFTSELSSTQIYILDPIWVDLTQFWIEYAQLNPIWVELNPYWIEWEHLGRARTYSTQNRAQTNWVEYAHLGWARAMDK